MAQNEQLRRWQHLAEAARIFATVMNDAGAQAVMLRIAEEYEELARRMGGVTLH